MVVELHLHAYAYVRLERLEYFSDVYYAWNVSELENSINSSATLAREAEITTSCASLVYARKAAWEPKIQNRCEQDDESEKSTHEEYKYESRWSVFYIPDVSL